MRRRLFNVLAWLSLVVGVVSCVMWLRSYFVEEVVTVRFGRQRIGVASQPGRVAFFRGFGISTNSGGVSYARRFPDFYVRPNTLGFSAYRLSKGGVLITIPYWMLMLLSTVAPLIRWRRSRLHANGLCRACGYDLRATPDRCPECGAVPEAVSTGADWPRDRGHGNP
ncbi:MAG TPA: hypothetical protein VGN72_24395 [Tepidisphaeraceae bacterium]|nr:hypothetical protein [Tepidisphaeraceae bacterium]